MILISSKRTDVPALVTAWRLVLAVAVGMLFCAPVHAAGVACEAVPGAVQLSGATVTAEPVAPGAFQPQGGGAGSGRGGANPYAAALPAFCRVAATLRPTPQSSIRMEAWLPQSGWNGKLQVVGNGGFAGTISYFAMATALSAGYAAASTDTGHTGPSSNTFAHEAVLVDFAHRAVHETTVAAKRAIDYDEVRSRTPGAGDGVRLFMVPGMGHCGGGNGTSTFDMVAALDRWVTGGSAPASIPASRVRNGTVDRTRPLCPYPSFAVYAGKGEHRRCGQLPVRSSLRGRRAPSTDFAQRLGTLNWEP
jgi:hypothetical protein